MLPTAVLPAPKMMPSAAARGADLLRRQPSAAATAALPAARSVLRSWASRKFMAGLAVLLPIYVSLAISYWLLSAVDKVVAPVYDALLGTHVFGLGAVTACGIVLGTGVLASSWIGSAALGLGEWVLRRLPLVSHVYSAAKQVSLALDPRGGESGDGGSSSGPFRECVLFANPRFGGALMLGFVTGSTTLKQAAPGAGEDVPLLSIFAPTNHAYVGDTFLLPAANVTRTTLSVRDGLEALVSCGMGLPRSITALTGALAELKRRQLLRRTASAASTTSTTSSAVSGGSAAGAPTPGLAALVATLQAAAAASHTDLDWSAQAAALEAAAASLAAPPAGPSTPHPPALVSALLAAAGVPAASSRRGPCARAALAVFAAAAASLPRAALTRSAAVAVKALATRAGAPDGPSDLPAEAERTLIAWGVATAGPAVARPLALTAGAGRAALPAAARAAAGAALAACVAAPGGCKAIDAAADGAEVWVAVQAAAAALAVDGAPAARAAGKRLEGALAARVGRA